jgi:hypothetical protein
MSERVEATVSKVGPLLLASLLAPLLALLLAHRQHPWLPALWARPGPHILSTVTQLHVGGRRAQCDDLLTRAAAAGVAPLQVSMWLLGTAVGGGLGLLVMAFEPLATSPVGLMVVLVAFTFCVGLLGQTQASSQAALPAGHVPGAGVGGA